MAFWHFSWDFTKVEIMTFFGDFFRLGTIQRSLNSIFLVLIPKKGDAEKLKDFRPISLVGSLYKSLASLGKLMTMNLQDIYQERELVLVVIKVELILLRIKLGLIFVGV